MSDHSLLVRVRDRARFEFAHGGERFFDACLHFSEEIIRKSHPAYVDREVEIVVTQEIFLKPRPERRGSHSVCVTETPHRLEYDYFHPQSKCTAIRRGLQTLQYNFSESLRFLDLGRLIARTSDAYADIDVTLEGIHRAAEALGCPERLISKTDNLLRTYRFLLSFFACARIFFVAMKHFVPRFFRIVRVRAVGSLCHGKNDGIGCGREE